MSTYLLSCRLLKFKHAYRLDGDCFVLIFFSRLSPERLQETSVCCSAGIISYNVNVLPVLTDWWNKVECVQIKTENVLLWNKTPQQWSSLFVTTLMNMATFQNQKQVKFKKQTNRLYTAHETLITSKACSLFSLLHPSNSVLKHWVSHVYTAPTNSEWPYFYYRSVLNW